MTDILNLLRTGDGSAAIEQIEREGTPAEIAERYGSLVVNLYWKARDLGEVVVVSRAGIKYCLERSVGRGVSAHVARELRTAAMGLAYNAGSFTWQGWQEAGISPTAEEVAFGRECARLSMRVAVELEKPPMGVSKAHWLLGAHALSAREYEVAEKEFEGARDVLPSISPEATAMGLCNGGYAAIARLCRNAGDSAAEKSLEESIELLTVENSEDSLEFARQLKLVRKFFVAS